MFPKGKSVGRQASPLASRMGCTYSKRPKQSNGSLEPARAATTSRRSSQKSQKMPEELKTGRELKQKKSTKRRTPFVYPESEVSPLPPEPPSFGRKESKTRKKKQSPTRRAGTVTGLREFAREDKDAFLVDRIRVKEKKKQYLSDEDEDTIYELPTKMPEFDFSNEFEQASF